MEVKFVWIPRGDNLVADEAAKLAAEKAVPVYLEHLQARRDEFEEAPVAKRLRTVGRNTCESYGIPYHDCVRSLPSLLRC